MAQPNRKALAAAVLQRHGRTYADELDIPLEKQTPSPLFRLLVFALLASARISAEQAVKASRALQDAGWSTAKRMGEATWKQRVEVLNKHGYARYDESTAGMLQDTCDLLEEQYGGDLRKLRAQAGGDPARLRERIKACKGIGDTGADIFFREAQRVWDELYPFADKKVLAAAKRLGLGDDAKALKGHVESRADYVRLVTGLIRVDLADDEQAVRDAARDMGK